MRQCLYTSCYKIIVQVAGVLSNSLIILRNIYISVMPSLPLATNSVTLKNIYQFSMSEIILYMYKGVIVHQLSSLNICFTTFINKNGLSTCSSHYSSPCSPFHTFHNFQKLQKSHFFSVSVSDSYGHSSHFYLFERRLQIHGLISGTLQKIY